jgi:hypothetical protein
MNIGLVLLTLFFIGVVLAAYFIAQKYLYQGFDNDNRCSLVTFTTVLTSGIGLLMMIVVEIAGLEDKSFRLELWVLIIGVLNYSMLVIVPVLLILKSAQKIVGDRGWMASFLLASGLYLLGVFYFLSREVCVKNKVEITWMNMLSYSAYIFKPYTQFNFLSKIGVCMISTLSGFGCVYMPFQFLRYYDPLITQINKDKIEEDMRILMQETVSEKLEMAQLCSDFSER